MPFLLNCNRSVLCKISKRTRKSRSSIFSPLTTMPFEIKEYIKDVADDLPKNAIFPAPKAKKSAAIFVISFDK